MAQPFRLLSVSEAYQRLKPLIDRLEQEKALHLLGSQGERPSFLEVFRRADREKPLPAFQGVPMLFQDSLAEPVPTYLVNFPALEAVVLVPAKPARRVFVIEHQPPAGPVQP